MVYQVRKLPNQNKYKVTNKKTKKVYGITKNPRKFIQAIEINKKK